MSKVVIVGAGFGGLAAAAELARSGQDVTVLEAHIYPGGCAGTFYHQGYRFDAGATLAGGFAPGAPMDLLGRHFGIDWEARLASRALQVHLPGQSPITRWMDSQAWQVERINTFGVETEPFWEWQEKTANSLWDFALRLPPWPPQSASGLLDLIQTGLFWRRENIRYNSTQPLVALAADAFRPVAAHIPSQPSHLHLFLDGQLLIASQTTSRFANALYAAVALDLPRQGVAHIPGGMGGMADKLIEAIRRYGGRVQFRQEVTRVRYQKGAPAEVNTKRGEAFSADRVIFNLPPWNIASLLIGDVPRRLRNLPVHPRDGWGAFMLYVGFDEGIIPDGLPLHHQVVVSEPLGEGNSIFLSISPEWDESRSPQGKRALTISTHTNLAQWWELYQNDRPVYERRKEIYTTQLLTAAERAIPGLQGAADLVMSGTPVTFQRFTRRAWGWVGGFPQTDLFRVWGPRLAPGLWMVGDTIFPGQSVPAVVLGGVRVAHTVLRELAPARRRYWRRTEYQQLAAGD